MNRVLITKHHIAGFRKADNSRVSRIQSPDRSGPMSGWDQMRARMIGIGGVPMIYCFSTCKDSIRTIPVCQHDPDRAEDLWKHGEDHCADEWRYACMARPFMRSPPEKEETREAYAVPSEMIPDDSFKTM